MKKWKLVLIVLTGIVAVAALGVFGVQSSQNKAFMLEEQVSAAGGATIKKLLSDNFSADGIVYHEIEDTDIELYCDKKDIIAERKIADFLTANKIYYEKQEIYIDSEKMIQVIFEI